MTIHNMSIMIENFVPIDPKDCVWIDGATSNHQATFRLNTVTFVREMVHLFDILHAHLDVMFWHVIS